MGKIQDNAAVHRYRGANQIGARSSRCHRDYVRGLEVVTADGSVLTAGGKNVKDASGLSLKNLYIGSEGTLAVITKCIQPPGGWHWLSVPKRR